MPQPALGLIETSGIDGALAASKAAVFASEVVIVSTGRIADGGMVVKIEGDWKAVGAAVDAGARAAEKAGQLSAMHVIPKTGPDLGGLMPYEQLLRQLRRQPVALPKPAAPRPVKAPSKPKSVPRPAASSAPSSPAAPSPVPSPVSPHGAPAWTELEAMSVVNLRKHARAVAGLPIQGRQISKANKQQLLEALKSIRESVG
jgi:microcompartment protein CcmL/EutN